MKSKNSTRIRFVYFCVLFVAVILVARLYVVQIISGDDYRAQADRQYAWPATSVFDRGSIYFSTKDGDYIAAATLEKGYLLVINPGVIKNPQLTYEKLNAIVPLNREVFLEKAARENDTYEELAKQVSDEDGQKIKSLGLAGVNLYEERWRVYPGGKLAAHTLGFLGYLGDDYAGRYGLERQYEQSLKRRGEGLYANFFADIFSNFQKFGDSDVIEGDIYTTIEPTVENELENALAKINETWQSDWSGGIIINPQTGQIYAMAVHPTFDSNFFQKEKSVSVFANKLIEDVYEMGSIIKPLTIAVGLDTGAITATSTYYDNASITINGKTIWNFDLKGRGRVSMQEILSQSLNTGATHVMLQVGRKEFSKYFKSFGLGEKTGIDLPNETSGLITNLDSPRDIEHATASFGQGIAMTPIETVRALSAVANGGTLVKPYLVEKVNYRSGLVKKIIPSDGERVLKKETTESVTQMLVNVVDKALLGGTVKIPQYSVAAKTGTAQIAKPGERGYYEDRYLHSFFGYFPAYNPQFLVFLYTYYPKGVRYASETLTSTFIDLTKFLISYYDLPPDR